MSALNMVVFDVQRGLCVFLQSPTGYGVMIDCGRSDHFSPAKWLCQNVKANLKHWGKYPLAWMIVTHPHDDHVEDIDYVTEELTPAILRREKGYDWDALLNPDREPPPSENVASYHSWQATYTQPVTVYPDLGMELSGFNLSPREAAAIDTDPQHLVNNSSHFAIISFANWKILISGDTETEGWEEILKKQKVRNALVNVDIVVTPHHGHDSGFSAELYAAMGKPLFNITSERQGDESVCCEYSNPERVSGIKYDGKDRYNLTTRSDHSIFVEMTDDDKYEVECIPLVDND